MDHSRRICQPGHEVERGKRRGGSAGRGGRWHEWERGLGGASRFDTDPAAFSARRDTRGRGREGGDGEEEKGEEAGRGKVGRHEAGCEGCYKGGGGKGEEEGSSTLFASTLEVCKICKAHSSPCPHRHLPTFIPTRTPPHPLLHNPSPYPLLRPTLHPPYPLLRHAVLPHSSRRLHEYSIKCSIKLSQYSIKYSIRYSMELLPLPSPLTSASSSGTPVCARARVYARVCLCLPVPVCVLSVSVCLRLSACMCVRSCVLRHRRDSWRAVTDVPVQIFN